jgi:hypothetical protein
MLYNLFNSGFFFYLHRTYIHEYNTNFIRLDTRVVDDYARKMFEFEFVKFDVKRRRAGLAIHQIIVFFFNIFVNYFFRN